MEIIVSEVFCPKCGAEEMHPRENKLLIRGFKAHDGVAWRSQCLVCAGYYSADLETFDQEKGDPEKGWF